MDRDSKSIKVITLVLPFFMKLLIAKNLLGYQVNAQTPLL